jgi:hypothetical protein
MTYKNFFVVSLVALFLGGCGSMPKTPELLIQNVNGGAAFSEKDTFEVKQPIATVSEVLKKKSHECFEQEISHTSQGDTTGGIRMDRHITRQLTPKVVVGKQHTRLVVQAKTTQGSTELGDIPPDGWYMLVVDAYPVNKNTTRVETYYQQTSFRGAYTAIKPWITGTNMSCPDLTE